jgi:Sensors of blue-light using FAD
MPLERLIYRSDNAINASGARALVHFHDIVATARRKNKERGICGFLMFDRTQFYQILEGESGDLSALYDVIVRDNRHSGVVCLSRNPIETRSFPDWSMASFFNDKPSHPLLLSFGIKSLADIPAHEFLAFARSYVQQNYHD